MHAAEVLRELSDRGEAPEIVAVIHTTIQQHDEWSYTAMMGAVHHEGRVGADLDVPLRHRPRAPSSDTPGGPRIWNFKCLASRCQL
jgi:hypothetical protein